MPLLTATPVPWARNYRNRKSSARTSRRILQQAAGSADSKDQGERILKDNPRYKK